MALTLLAGPVIAAGESLSAGLDCSAGSIIRLTMPAAWDFANLSFQISGDGVAYSDVYTVEGHEIVIPAIPGTTVIVADPRVSSATGGGAPDLRGATFIKVRSGTRAHPVIQTAQRTFAVMLETP